jgi:hypothetical protein
MPIGNLDKLIVPAGFRHERVMGNGGGIPYACLGIDIQPMFSAPFGELVRICVYPDDLDPAALLEFMSVFGPPQPLQIGPGEFIAIFKSSFPIGMV